jgi:hypothetical protein
VRISVSLVHIILIDLSILLLRRKVRSEEKRSDLKALCFVKGKNSENFLLKRER